MNVESTSWESDPYIGSEAHRRELAAFDALTDDEIDFSDIPEQDPEDWQGARRGNHFFTRRDRDAVLVDTEVIAWFRQRYPEYQKAMNAALHDYMESHNDEDAETEPDLRKTA
ncbi:MAG: BrnA antitoxin family protein [Thermomicrobiales bacterium]